MKRVRITYEVALHHMMNWGIQGENIFIEAESKSAFLDILKDKSVKMKILSECP
ncbi:MAG: hypothetical protein GTO45_17645 [Candidatus Aminicenantes bacterium]|nr:hypothetical protein [Candidatus Aminicenantes bacterium]NIM80574.1 hypothetical protein [Candidatus Aminicenantes bacterium]NIN19955.1 hypothetical protein [Candidatus Aminicenantes bacterium]NIN43803.1 hypothetical protein [Candidatus Aminicenantes bacterium]NIN86581.1 hypothetical protein [Candidatus Aminicenantes bacterium]